jgi:glutathione S-transferase
VPALEDDDMPGIILTQIPAILNYLLEKSNNKDL